MRGNHCRAPLAALLVASVAFGCDARPQDPARSAALRLPSLFTDGLVLQRDTPVPVWGRAAPGVRVTVTFDGRTVRGRADEAGSWRVQLPARPAGGPFVVTVAAGDTTVSIGDVLVGDVWVASGQSNMEFALAQAETGQAEIASAHDPGLRQFYVPHAFADAPQTELPQGTWTAADSQHAGGFTAVGYFFARDLRAALEVPVGIIHTSWGGANIETWISRQGLGLSEQAMDSIRAAQRAYVDGIRASLQARIGDLPKVDRGLVEGRAVWADPALNDSAWADFPVPGSWGRAGYAGMAGVGWLRTSVRLTEAEASQGARLALGVIGGADITWVNGVQVGQTGRMFQDRLYDVPASVLRPGRNVLAVRVESNGGMGGILGRPNQVWLDVGNERRRLPNSWKFRVGVAEVRPDDQRINKVPTFLYNQMIHPLQPFPIKGVIWYQGESNANSYEQAMAYRPLFADLIRSWRKEWGGGDFPFLWVQLPNFGPLDTIPPEHPGWAALRESQTAALALPQTGQAIAIDVGEADNIHPRNKRTVGQRLARVARAVAYGQKVEDSGPTFRTMTARDGRVTLAFDHVAGGLVSHGPNGELSGFAVAGEDRRFAWAEARIEGDQVVVWDPAVPDPVAVRYLWADSPARVDLFNSEGLPAAPFRTDDW
jgi:sialate O-acetylesterase